MSINSLHIITRVLPNDVSTSEWEEKRVKLAAFIESLFPGPATNEAEGPALKASLRFEAKWSLVGEGGVPTSAPSTPREPKQKIPFPNLTSRYSGKIKQPRKKKPKKNKDEPAPEPAIAEPAAAPTAEPPTETEHHVDVSVDAATAQQEQPILPLSELVVYQIAIHKSATHGRGVFAARAFRKGDVIEVCPVLDVPAKHIGGRLRDYVYGGDFPDTRAIVLGAGMMYNSSKEPNVEYHKAENGDFVFSALRDVVCGEELTHYYGDEWWESRERKRRRLQERQRKEETKEQSEETAATAPASIATSTEEAATEQTPAAMEPDTVPDSGNASGETEEAETHASTNRTVNANTDAEGGGEHFFICVADSPIHGRGVFATKDFVKGEVVEACPTIEVEEGDVGGRMNDYVYYGTAESKRIVVMGYGMLYNSSREPNLWYYKDRSSNFVFVASRDISCGEELVHDYGDEWWSSRNLTQ